ncbi:RluA family pseudouridine synthase [Mycoplasmopsis primatum]|uniref:RluA family pseudouridine synthase n=1 Tax=Mycoplasmopsis primatum TaxID=55604 RepID=UPI00049769F1|nr:RluA family pseudouridine synthase [Mycoplasmopsis primatum]
MQKFIATQNDNGRKLIKFLQRIFKNVPDSYLHKILRNRNVKINNQRVNDANFTIKTNDEIIVYRLDSEEKSLYAFDDNIKLSSPIIYEDENILVVNKIQGVEVHGSKNSLDNQVLSYLKFNQESSFKPSHVGRLDKLTSGIMLYAKNYSALVELNNKTGLFDKIYILKSEYNKPDQEVKLFIYHDEKQQKMVATDKVKNESQFNAITKIFTQNKKLYAQIYTGKKHQIRATMEYLGFPILGDTKYGGLKSKRLFLHCCKLTLKELEGNLAYLNNKTFECKQDW